MKRVYVVAMLSRIEAQRVEIPFIEETKEEEEEAIAAEPLYTPSLQQQTRQTANSKAT